jgi:hypothetical protein
MRGSVDLILVESPTSIGRRLESGLRPPRELDVYAAIRS